MLTKASVTFDAEDRSALSRALRTSLLMPRYLPPMEAGADQIDRMMDWGDTIFVLVIPAAFEADVRAGRTLPLQLNIDATKTVAAGVGTGYLTATFNEEIARFAGKNGRNTLAPAMLTMLPKLALMVM